jgi:hypothetical protein
MSGGYAKVEAVMHSSGLCEKHGITVHIVGDIYSSKQDGSAIAQTDLHKWCVAAPFGAFEQVRIEAIPLSETAEEAEANAVQYLGLA